MRKDLKLFQVGWLVLMDRERLTFALLLVLLSVGCSIISLSESYRALSTAQPMLLQEERTFDLWAVSGFLFPASTTGSFPSVVFINFWKLKQDRLNDNRVFFISIALSIGYLNKL